MRDIVVWYSEGSNANKVAFEGTVEKQELVTGPIGGPANAMSMTMSGAHRAVSSVSCERIAVRPREK